MDAGFQVYGWAQGFSGVDLSSYMLVAADILYVQAISSVHSIDVLDYFSTTPTDSSFFNCYPLHAMDFHPLSHPDFQVTS